MFLFGYGLRLWVSVEQNNRKERREQSAKMILSIPVEKIDFGGCQRAKFELGDNLQKFCEIYPLATEI
ncbi:hypothetical protein B0187_02820 [Haemophilus paracuniculus]|uniref:Uncharacterized protein n=1 Tax=Haemophilus paracuniculus TaxID=734 RepID=A0A1T0AU92_9PAST|nr:hypothetical protein [Haemophilus paracuniculus]OOR99757.1 hypothetical protein B0187_02820 [Haemophilus paracuniculus]